MPTPEPALFAAIAVLFLGTLVRATLGFGEALVAVPLLALFLPVTVAAPVAVLVSIAIAMLILLRDFHKVHLHSAGKLIVSTLFGIPLGLMMLTEAPERVVKIVLGSVIMLFAVHPLLLRRRDQALAVQLPNDRWAWIFGWLAGVLGGAYGINGPPLAIYGMLRRWSPEEFRATLQAYFLVASVVGMAGYGFTGLWTREVNVLFAVSLPSVVLATFLGHALHHRLRNGPEKFRKWVFAGLFLTGALLVAQALATRRG